MREKRLPRLNFRPLLFAACALIFGIIFYEDLYRGTISYAEWAVWAILFLLAAAPFDLRRFAFVFIGFLMFALLGAGCMAGYTKRYVSGSAGGNCSVSGTIVSLSVYEGYSVVMLDDIAVDGGNTGGMCRVTLPSDSLRTGDIVLFRGELEHVAVKTDAVNRSYFSSDVRYTAHADQFETTGQSKNIFLMLNRAIYDCLHENLSKDEADIAYALLTGSSEGVDSDLMGAIRTSGIAHVFAVSGLHIGIIFAAVALCCSKLGKWKYLPAVLIAIGFSALCGFSVSSVRAVIMCSVLGLQRVFGRKADFLQSISLAAIIVLILFPAQWYSAGFRLSFGACMGLALFSGSIGRLLRFLPVGFGGYLAATLSVQAVTFPCLLESFGYVSVWGTLLNLIVVPCMPVFYLCVLVFTMLSLVLPFAAPVLLAVPSGLLSLFLYLFQTTDFSLVLTGFSLGAGAAVWLIACILLSERVRLSVKARSAVAAGCALLFTCCVVLQNMMFVGCKITSYAGYGGSAVLLQTNSENVLLVSGDVSIRDCESFLARTYGGELTAVVIVGTDRSAVNCAAFLPAGECRLKDEQVTGLKQTEVLFGSEFSYGDLRFRYENAHKIVLSTQGIVVEFDFEGGETIGGDLYINGLDSQVRYYLMDGVIYALT